MNATATRSHDLAAFDKTLQKTNQWLDELSQELDWRDRKQSYAALRATLHALRDRLPMGEAVDLASQLPMLVRGFYYEGWKPAATPVKVRHLEEFLEPVEAALTREQATPAEDVARAVFRLLASHVSAGEMEDVISVLPPELRQLFPTLTEA